MTTMLYRAKTPDGLEIMIVERNDVSPQFAIIKTNAHGLAGWVPLPGHDRAQAIMRWVDDIRAAGCNWNHINWPNRPQAAE